MSESDSVISVPDSEKGSSKRLKSSADVEDLEKEIRLLKHQLKEKEYTIHYMNSMHRLMRDTLKKLKIDAKKAVYEVDSMFEGLEYKVINGEHLKFDGDCIYYDGEPRMRSYEDWKKNPSPKREDTDSGDEFSC